MFCWTVWVRGLQVPVADEDTKPSRTKIHHGAGTVQARQAGRGPVHVLHLNKEHSMITGRSSTRTEETGWMSDSDGLHTRTRRDFSSVSFCHVLNFYFEGGSPLFPVPSVKIVLTGSVSVNVLLETPHQQNLSAPGSGSVKPAAAVRPSGHQVSVTSHVGESGGPLTPPENLSLFCSGSARWEFVRTTWSDERGRLTESL